VSTPDGTLDDAPDDAPKPGDGTPSGTPDDGDGDDNKGKLIATLQENVAKERREKEELARKVEELSQRESVATPPTRGDGAPSDRAAAYVAAIRAAAADPNNPNHDYAVFELEKWRAQRAEIEEVKLNLRFDAMPEAERDGARKFFETGDYRTPDAARKAWLGSLSDEERAKLKPRSERPKPEPVREREEVVDTATRPLSPQGVASRSLKMGEWHREYDKAEAAGDTKRMNELRQAYPR